MVFCVPHVTLPGRFGSTHQHLPTFHPTHPGYRARAPLCGSRRRRRRRVDPDEVSTVPPFGFQLVAGGLQSRLHPLNQGSAG